MRNTSKNRSTLEIKYSAAIRHAMWYYLPQTLDLVRVCEFPKSGGSWLSNMIAEYLDIRFPQFETPPFKRCLLQGHHLPRTQEYKMVGVLRDGRDALVSCYYHMMLGNDRTAGSATPRWRKMLPLEDYQNVEKNLPNYIEFMFTRFPMSGGKLTWANYVNKLLASNAMPVRYEDLLNNAAGELVKVAEFLTSKPSDYEKAANVAQKYAFSAEVKRNPGEENLNSFLRKGVAGDWRNKFTLESAQIFDHFAGKELVAAGYEPNHDWVQDTFLKKELQTNR